MSLDCSFCSPKCQVEGAVLLPVVSPLRSPDKPSHSHSLLLITESRASSQKGV